METSLSNGDNGNTHSLFGGAFTCFLPNNALDASEIRDIPDNQEVFCHKNTDQSIMVDILEYQDHVNGSDAVKYHFLDLVESNDAGNDHEIIMIESIPKSSICMTESSDAWFLTGRQNISKFKEESQAKNCVDMYTMLYRLPQYHTDILIILNNPVSISKDSSSSLHANSLLSSDAWTLDMFKQIACSLTLHNCDIFGEG